MATPGSFLGTGYILSEMADIVKYNRTHFSNVAASKVLAKHTKETSFVY